MTFNKSEQAAIARVGKILILADGKLNEDEMAQYDMELSRIGVSSAEELQEVLEVSEGLEPAAACAIISQMDDDKKTYVAAFLGTLIVVDGEKDSREVAAWGVVGQFCGLPSMTIGEAVKYMTNL